jgi:O-antigen/teichoic acid export membrane protein
VVSSIWLAGLFDVPPKFLPTFRWLVGGQSALLGFTFGARIFGFVLQAHHRYDAFNYAQIGSFALNLLVLWAGFIFGGGVYSLLLASAASLLFTAFFTGIASQRLGLMPRRNSWGSISGAVFRNLFGYAVDIFLLSIGQQLISTSQVFVVSRTMGLSAAAVWSVATKAFLLGQQMVWRILDFSAAAFSEMMTRQETDRLKNRFRDVVILTASVSVIMGGAVALCNPSFLKIWTHDRISWSLSADLLMGLSVVVYSVTRCFTGFIGLTKEIRWMKFIYIIEGASFVLQALLAVRHFGFAGVIGAGVLTNLLCSGAYGIVRADKYLAISSREMIFGWMKFPGRLLLITTVVATALWFSIRELPAWAQLLIGGGMLTVISCFSLWQFGLPPAFQKEAASLLLRARQRWLPAR